ncbi:MAG: cytochrome c [Acidobacteriia bacterium]|nr:cytochrome c [Terriglobia bacterium]
MENRRMVLVLVVLIAVFALPALADGPDGKALFDAKCAMCHGKDGVAKPMAKNAANLNDAKWQAATTADAIEKIISGGKGKMPKYAEKLKPEEIKAIAAYVKSLGPK